MMQNTSPEKRILLCGDSITGGITYDSGRKKYVFLDQSVVKSIGGHLSCPMDNISKFGNTVKRAKRYFIRALEQHHYDYIVFELGGNDCDFDWKAIAHDPEKEHDPNISLNEFKAILSEMIQMAFDHGAVPILTTLPPIDASRYFQWISSFAYRADERILSWLGSVDRIYWWQERYNAAVLQMAREHQCRVLDVRSALLCTDDFRACYCKDGIHPNAQGHQIMADAILQEISQIQPDLLLSS